MTTKDQKYLLRLARRTIEKYLQNKNIIQLEDSELTKTLLDKRATFVTLNKNHNLRGCIGDLEPQKSLYQSVIDNSLASAFLDPRFPPVKEDELKDIIIEISILSPLKKLQKFNSLTDFLQYLNDKKPGLFIKKGSLQATFLPQVWEELPEAKNFMTQLCLKAGLEPNEWQNLNLEMFEYEVEKFKEE